MFTSLGMDKLGFKVSLQETIDLAQKYGFQGVDFNITDVAQIAERQGVEQARGIFTQANIRPSLTPMPYSWSRSEEDWRKLQEALPKAATLAREIGTNRFVSGVSPYSDERPYKENFEFAVKRLRPVAEILREHGCRLGIEFIAPKTLRRNHKYEFIYNIDGVLELAHAVGTGNIGMLLDAWHWYTSPGTLADLEKLSNNDVVAVHVNDAPTGIPVDEQQDLVRRMPMETGVIDLVGFLKALDRMNYDGPVTVEPFSERVRSLSPEEAAAETVESLRKAFAAAGLSI